MLRTSFLLGVTFIFFSVFFLLYNVLRSAGISVPYFIFFIIPKVTSQIFLVLPFSFLCLWWPSEHLQFCNPSSRPVAQAAFSHSPHCLRARLVEYILLGRRQLYKLRFKCTAFLSLKHSISYSSRIFFSNNIKSKKIILQQKGAVHLSRE